MGTARVSPRASRVTVWMSECSSQDFRHIASSGAEEISSKGCLYDWKYHQSEHCLAVNLPARQRTSAQTMSRSSNAVGSSCKSVNSINPPAVFVFGSNSWEMNGWRTPSPAKMGQHQTQMSEPLSSVPSPKELRVPFVGRYRPGRAGSGTEIKGIHKEHKVPRCNQPSMFLQSQLSQVRRWKELSFSLQGLLAWIKMCNHIILPRGASQHYSVHLSRNMTCFVS